MNIINNYLSGKGKGSTMIVLAELFIPAKISNMPDNVSLWTREAQGEKEGRGKTFI